MSKQNILNIQTLEGLDIKANGEKYNFLCEYNGVNGDMNRSVYCKEGGTDIIVAFNDDNKAIVGLFSTKQSKINDFFNYIESTISPKDGFACMETQTMKELLGIAKANGGNYSLIQKEVEGDKQPILSKINAYFYKPKLDISRLAKIQDHLFSINYIHAKTPELSNASFVDDFNLPPEYSKAESLPEGWSWVNHKDGSGHLESPDGKAYFSYDEAPYYPHGIEYKETKDGTYGPYWGSIDDFKGYAEKIVERRYIEKEKEVKEMWKPENDKEEKRKRKSVEIER